MSQYASEMVQKSNTYGSVESIIRLHSPFYRPFCVMPQGSLPLILAGFLGWSRREEWHTVSTLCIVFLEDRSPCCFCINILLQSVILTYGSVPRKKYSALLTNTTRIIMQIILYLRSFVKILCFPGRTIIY